MGKAVFGRGSNVRVIAPSVPITEVQERIVPEIQERIVEKEIIKYVEVPVEKLVHIDRPIEVIKYIDKIIEKQIEVIKEVPVEVIKEIQVIKEVVLHDITGTLAEKANVIAMEKKMKSWRMAAIGFIILNILGGALCLMVR